MIDRLRNPRIAAGLILAAALATIAGALVFEYGFGLTPCPLCLRQRIPYYIAMPVALATVFLPARWARLGLALLAVIFVVSAGLGIHHAGVEWGWWAGPADCAGAPPPAPNGMGDFLNQLQKTRVVSCTEAAWRFLGLSLAGWNVLISFALAAFALAALVPSRHDQGPQTYGSSSVSQ